MSSILKKILEDALHKNKGINQKEDHMNYEAGKATSETESEGGGCSQDDSCTSGTESRLDQARRLWGKSVQVDDSATASDTSEQLDIMNSLIFNQ